MEESGCVYRHDNSRGGGGKGYQWEEGRGLVGSREQRGGKGNVGGATVDAVISSSPPTYNNLLGGPSTAESCFHGLQRDSAI